MSFNGRTGSAMFKQPKKKKTGLEKMAGGVIKELEPPEERKPIMASGSSVTKFGLPEGLAERMAAAAPDEKDKDKKKKKTAGGSAPKKRRGRTRTILAPRRNVNIPDLPEKTLLGG